MSSSTALARVGLAMAISVVVAISTFGPLLKEIGPRDSNAARLPGDFARVPATDAAAVGVVRAPPAASVPAAEVQPASSPTTPAEVSSAPKNAASEFPPMQTLADDGRLAAGNTRGDAPAPEASASGSEKTAHGKRDWHIAKRRAPVRPAPYEIREFLAGR